jgi:hypothetical protein
VSRKTPAVAAFSFRPHPVPSGRTSPVREVTGGKTAGEKKPEPGESVVFASLSHRPDITRKRGHRRHDRRNDEDTFSAISVCFSHGTGLFDAIFFAAYSLKTAFCLPNSVFWIVASSYILL